MRCGYHVGGGFDEIGLACHHAACGGGGEEHLTAVGRDSGKLLQTVAGAEDCGELGLCGGKRQGERLPLVLHKGSALHGGVHEVVGGIGQRGAAAGGHVVGEGGGRGHGGIAGVDQCLHAVDACGEPLLELFHIRGLVLPGIEFLHTAVGRSHAPSAVVHGPGLGHGLCQAVYLLVQLLLHAGIYQTVELVLHGTDEERVAVELVDEGLDRRRVLEVHRQVIVVGAGDVAVGQVFVPHRAEAEFGVGVAVRLDRHDAVPVGGDFGDEEEFHPTVLIVVGAPSVRVGAAVEGRFPGVDEPVLNRVDDGVARGGVGLVGRFRVLDVHLQVVLREAHGLVEHVAPALELHIPARVLVNRYAVGVGLGMVGHLIGATVVAVDDQVDEFIARCERHAHHLGEFGGQRVAYE